MMSLPSVINKIRPNIFRQKQFNSYNSSHPLASLIGINKPIESVREKVEGSHFISQFINYNSILNKLSSRKTLLHKCFHSNSTSFVNNFHLDNSIIPKSNFIDSKLEWSNSKFNKVTPSASTLPFKQNLIKLNYCSTDLNQLFCVNNNLSARLFHMDNRAISENLSMSSSRPIENLPDSNLSRDPGNLQNTNYPGNDSSHLENDSGNILQNKIKLEKPFLPKKALILRKFSRLEYERMCHPNIDENQLRENLSQRGADFDSLVYYDHVQKTCLRHIESTLTKSQIEWKTVDRFAYTEDMIDWADVIITSGGDGTFLMAASKVNSRDKPVIGVNSDPTKSVGHLCLASQYSNNFNLVLELLAQGKYQWQFRQRLRITLIGDAANEEPRELYDMRLDLRGVQDLDIDHITHGPARPHSPSHSSNTCIGTFNYNQHTLHYHHVNSFGSPELTTKKSTLTRNAATHLSSSPIGEDLERSRAVSARGIKELQHSQNTSKHSPNATFRTDDGKIITQVRQLKEKALNEVFVGETLSARVSYYELSIDNNRRHKMKSSGLTVCTGTGSTSWYYNINKVTKQCVETLVQLINKKCNSNLPTDESTLHEITQQFNDTLTFQANKSIMAYSVRDPVDSASNPSSHNHRGFAKRIEVKSRMQNACLVIDGCQFYPFDDGSYALMETFDEDALRTITLQ